VKYFDIDDSKSCDKFRSMDYRMAVFPFLSPFESVFEDVAKEAILNRTPLPKCKIRRGFEPDVPIFNVATGPWLMCTQEFVRCVTPHVTSGLMFVNHETEEMLIPGT
jgi:hypothetical protein